jgi:AcrR family transcriptional regulator
VLAGAEALDEIIGLVPRQPSARHGCIDPLAGVPAADVAHGGVEVAGLSSGTQPRGLRTGDPPRLHHAVELPQQALTSDLVRRVSVVHGQPLYGYILSMSSHNVQYSVTMYTLLVPKLWSETIAAHRRDVVDAILETTAALVAEQGLRAVTMSQIAEETGIGRATLYKYYPDVESILVAWHDRHVAGHLAHLVALRDQPGNAWERLHAVLEAYALIIHERSRRHRGADLVAFVHQEQRVAKAQAQLARLVRDLLAEGVHSGHVRDDVSADELASYCLHALSGAGALPSKAAVARLVTLTLGGLRP